MHLFRRLTAMLLSLVLIISLAGCGNGRASSGGSHSGAGGQQNGSREKAPFLTAQIAADGDVTLSWTGNDTCIYEVSRTDEIPGGTVSVAVVMPGEQLCVTDPAETPNYRRTYVVTPYLTEEDLQSGNAAWSSGELTVCNGFLLEDGYLSHYADNVMTTDATVNGLYFDRKGIYTSGDRELDDIIAGLICEMTTPEMEPVEKLDVLYHYIANNKNFKYGAARFITPDITDWQTDSAKAFLTSGIGNCFSYSAAVMLCARAVGLEAYTVIGKCTQLFETVDHCWTEVILDGRTYLCDAEMEGIYAPNHWEEWDLFMEEYGTTPTKYEIPEADA